MISIKSAAFFTAELQPSKLLQRLFIACHIIAAMAGLANALPLFVKIPLILLIGIHFSLNIGQFKQENRRLRYLDTLGWQLAEGNEFETITLLGSSVLTRHLLFLHIADKAPLVIASDALSAETYRHLQVKLKITLTNNAAH